MLLGKNPNLDDDFSLSGMSLSFFRQLKGGEEQSFREQSSSARIVVLWSQLIFLPSLLIGGLMIPSSALPGALGKVGLLLPATHVMNVYQGLVQNQTTASNPLLSVIILLAGGVMAFGLALYFFSWDSQNQTQRGHPAMAVVTLLPYLVGAVLL